MDNPWIIHGFSTDNPWIIHGLLMVINPWMIHGESMRCHVVAVSIGLISPSSPSPEEKQIVYPYKLLYMPFFTMTGASHAWNGDGRHCNGRRTSFPLPLAVWAATQKRQQQQELRIQRLCLDELSIVWFARHLALRQNYSYGRIDWATPEATRVLIEIDSQYFMLSINLLWWGLW